jgi:hypothetical protein
VTSALSSHYVRLLHDRMRWWATWEPGDTVHVVQPGTVGRFDRDWVFQHRDNLVGLGFRCEISDELPVQDRMYVSETDFDIAPTAGLRAQVPLVIGAQAGVRLTLRAKRKYACALQVKAATSSHLMNLDEILIEVRACLLDRAWPVDWIIVVERVQAQDGFAFIARKKGVEIDLDVDVDFGPIPHLDALAGSAGLGVSRQHADLAEYRFLAGDNTTPIFTQGIRVRQSLWARILRQPGALLDPDGSVYDPNRRTKTIESLARLKASDRLYDAGRSDLSPEQIEALPLGVLFERLDQPMHFPSHESSDPLVMSDADYSDQMRVSLIEDVAQFQSADRDYRDVLEQRTNRVFAGTETPFDVYGNPIGPEETLERPLALQEDE